ncbi:hypothetical protein D3C72_2538590 [compost metagenome]
MRQKIKSVKTVEILGFDQIDLTRDDELPNLVVVGPFHVGFQDLVHHLKGHNRFVEAAFQ